MIQAQTIPLRNSYLWVLYLIIDNVEQVENYELYDPRTGKTYECGLKEAHEIIDAAVTPKPPPSDHSNGHGHSM